MEGGLIPFKKFGMIRVKKWEASSIEPGQTTLIMRYVGLPSFILKKLLYYIKKIFSAALQPSFSINLSLS